MSLWLYVFAGGSFLMGVMGWYMWFDFYMKTKDLSAPFLRVARSKGKKILLLVDSGAGSYKLVDAEREALGYTTKEFGNFEAYEEGIKPFGAGIKKVPLGLAHAELEVNVAPGTAVWIKHHGGDLTQESIDLMPDLVQYLYCDKIVKEAVKNNGKVVEPAVICGWIGPLMAQEDEKASTPKELWKKLVDKWKEGENFMYPAPKEIKEEPTCPQCKSELKQVITDRTYSTIPNQVVYALSNVRSWVQEVVSPLNMEMAIESTKLNTMKKARTMTDEYMKIILILGPLLMFGAIAYIMVTQQGGGDGPGMMENMGQSLKSGAGQ